MPIYIVCEGMLDDQVLRLIIVNHFQKNVQIEEVGGDSSLKSVRQWLGSKYQVKAYGIEDRNFRALADVEKTWQEPEGRHFIWRRHEIENYLLDPRIVALAFKTLKNSGIKGSNVLPETEREILEILTDLALPLLENHAGEVTFYWMREQYGLLGIKLLGPEKKNLLSYSSHGVIFPDRSGWSHYLQQEYQRLQFACENALTDPRWTLAVIEQFYAATLSSLKNPGFLEQGIFLQELGGHELLSQLLNQYLLTRLHFAISYADLTQELLDALDRLYQPGFFQPDDFQELALKLQ